MVDTWSITVFKQLLAAVQLRKELPDAVGYDIFGPISFPIPDEIRTIFPASAVDVISELTIAGLQIYNCSSKTQRDIRVLYSGAVAYTPRVSFHRRDVDVRFTLKRDDKEIVVNEIPPNEAVLIELFNPTPRFEIDQVLIGDKVITKLMQSLAEAKWYPSRVKTRALVFSSVVLSALMLVVAVNANWESKKNTKLISDAIAGQFWCSAYVFSNSPGNDLVLENKFGQLGVLSNRVLSLNKVTTFDELKKKSQIILCDPPTP